jgi:hypothetical protein
MAEQGAAGHRPEPPCTCEFADIGIGRQKVSEVQDCPFCTEFGYACWAVEHGIPAEQAAARAWLDDWEAEQKMPERLKADAALFHEGADEASALGATQRELSLQGLPWADVSDLAGGTVPISALASPEAWQAWLGEESGALALVDGQLQRETNFMARAEIGDTTGPYVKTGVRVDGTAVWDRK